MDSATQDGSATERTMTAPERAFLEQQLRQLPGPATRWFRGIQNAVLLWAVSTMSLVLLWLAFAWGARKLMQVEIGKTSDVAAWAAAICAAFAITSSVHWVKSWPNRRSSVEADLAEGRVTEERRHFAQARRFQEPEHGGLIYFLRADDGAVMAFFDHESQDLGARGEDPLTSSFAPRSDLLTVRAVHSRYVIEKQFSGDVLEAGSPAALTLEPSRWPDDGEPCDIPWAELDARLAAPQPG